MTEKELLIDCIEQLAFGLEQMDRELQNVSSQLQSQLINTYIPQSIYYNINLTYININQIKQMQLDNNNHAHLLRKDVSR